MQWEIVIGLEVHTQLSTNSKIFSGAPIAFGAAPNTQACAVDLALPGVLPVLNKGAVECAIKFGLAVGAHIAPRSVFARKNYFYPDLPKGYQISQFDLPVVGQGELAILVEPLSGSGKPTLTSLGQAYKKVVRITRAHLEEDAGKSLHEDFQGKTGIDLNRAGTPLLEIVSEPDMRSAAEAVAYAKALHSLVRWIGICDGNMQEGSFRCDANVSVRRPGEALGTRREIKNLNSFKFMQQAIEYEAQWQIDTLENGGKIHQATVLFDSDKCETRAMRSKEDAHDYRYFPDPDLLPLDILPQWIEEMRATLPELPQAKRERYINKFCLSPYDSSLLTTSIGVANYFEELVSFLEQNGASMTDSSKLAASWLNGEFSNALKATQVSIEDACLRPEWLASLLIRVIDGTISRSAARAIFPGMTAVAQKIRNGETINEFSIDNTIDELGWKQVSDSATIEILVDEIIVANPAQVAEYRSGKEKVFGYFVGLVMKASKGKANPAQMNEILKRKLGS